MFPFTLRPVGLAVIGCIRTVASLVNCPVGVLEALFWVFSADCRAAPRLNFCELAGVTVENITETKNLKDIDLNLLLIMDAMLKYNNVTQAAEYLGVSQSAVSHALARLRKLFQDHLFIKTNAAMMPTQKAEELAPVVSKIIQLAQDALFGQEGFYPETSDRIIKIGLEDVGELAVMPELLAYVRSHAPNCLVQTISASKAELLRLMGSGYVDLIISSEIGVSSQIHHQRIYQQRLVIIAHESCGLENSISLEQYYSLEHVRFEPQWINGAPREELGLMELTRTRRIKYSTPHALSVPFIVAKNPGTISVMPDDMVEQFKFLKELRVLEPEFDLNTVTIFQYWHNRLENDPYIKWLRKTVFNVAAKNGI